MASFSSSVLDDNTYLRASEHKRRLEGKLIYFTGSLDAEAVAVIVVTNLIIEVASTLTAVDDWGADTREAMIKLGQAFSERKSQISHAVLFGSLISGLLFVVMAFIMGVTARFVAGGIVGPINQLIDVVHSLYRMDFSRQASGTWMEARDSENPDQDKALAEATQDSFTDTVTNYELAFNYAESTLLYKKFNGHVMNLKLALAFADTLCPATKIAAGFLHWDSQTTKSQKKRLRRRLRLRLRRRVHLYRRRLRRRRNRRRRRRRRRRRHHYIDEAADSALPLSAE